MMDVRHLTKQFTTRRSSVTALEDISLRIPRGKTVGLVGESGSGKSTLGRCLLRLDTPSSGDILFEGRSIASYSKEELFAFRRRAQLIFQDPYAALSPRMTAGELIAEGLHIHRILPPQERTEFAQQLAETVGLEPSLLCRFPHEFSGGQRQRIGIARALALRPEFLVCDEPTSSLDVPIQAQIINLLKELQATFSLTYLFITHNLVLARYLSDVVAVLYAGTLVEIGDTHLLYAQPRHPYTQALLAPARTLLPPALAARRGCPFATRCPFATEQCQREKPALREVAPGHQVACHFDLATTSPLK